MKTLFSPSPNRRHSRAHFRHTLLAALCTAATLTGCAVNRSAFEPPATAMPAQWQHASGAAQEAASAAAAMTDGWWRAFNDPALDALIDAALRHNNNLAAAALRVRAAQLQAGLAANRPSFSGSLSHNKNRNLETHSSAQSSSFSLGVSYELDLWNRIGSRREMAEWEAMASEQDRQSAALALAGTTASLYWQLAYLNQRLAHAAQGIDHAQTTLDLIATQYQAGAVSGLEVAEARGNLASQKAALTTLQQQHVETSSALALLFDGQPIGPASANWSAPGQLSDGALPAVDADLPATLLGRRPDLRAAELRLRKSFRNIDATRASYYPGFSLTGSLGSSSRSLLDVLSNPVAALGAGISLPFLNVTEMNLNLDISKAQYEEAVVSFRQTLYTALAEVENALSARQQYEAQAVQLGVILADAQKVERLNEIRYRAGAIALKTWLDAQQSRRSAEIALAENRLNRLNNHATLLKALGGG
ncbi:MAG: efflux transporter outer membrane subunit, partial [Burkholderiaceae bacterium]|nr:efflux transporter outer membrane subunit [Burkholderiaceae bacterium]